MAPSYGLVQWASDENAGPPRRVDPAPAAAGDPPRGAAAQRSGLADREPRPQGGRADPGGRRRPAPRRGRPLLDSRPRGGTRVRPAPRGAGRRAGGGPPHRHARLLREAADHRRVEGAHQRPAPRRLLRDQRGAPAGATAAARPGRAGPPVGLRVPRPDHAAVHLGPRRVGRDRRAHDGEPGPPPARLGPLDAGRLQERHRRRRADRDRRRARRRAPPPLPRRHRAGARRHRLDARQPRLPRDLTGRRGRPELRRDPRAEGARRAPRREAPRAAHGGHEPRQQRQGPQAPARRRARRGVADRAGRGRDHRPDAGVVPRGGPAGPEGQAAPRLRPVHHRRVHGLGNDRARAAGPRRRRPGAAQGAPLARGVAPGAAVVLVELYLLLPLVAGVLGLVVAWRYRRRRLVWWAVACGILGGLAGSVLYVALILRHTSSTAAIGVIFVPWIFAVAAVVSAVWGLCLYQLARTTTVLRQGPRAVVLWLAAVTFLGGFAYYGATLASNVLTFRALQDPGAPARVLETRYREALAARNYLQLSAIAANPHTPPAILLEMAT